VVEAALVTVDLVREATLQRLARMIETLLCVPDSAKQLARERTRATIEPSLKIENIGYDQFRAGTWCGRAQVGHEIADGKIDFVTDRRDNWHSGIEYCASDNLFVEFP
jgi:hypothetical protein